WSRRQMERQQFEMANVSTESVPEFVLQRGQGDVFTIACFVNIVAGEAAIQGRGSRSRSLAGIEKGCSNQWQERHYAFGHRDINHPSFAGLRASQQRGHNADNR